MFNSSNLSDIVAELNWKSLTQHMSFMLVPAARSNEVTDILSTAPVTCHYKSGGVGYVKKTFIFARWEITLNKITLH